MHKLATKCLQFSTRTSAGSLRQAQPASLAFCRYNSSKSSDNPHSRSLRNLEALADLAKDPNRFPDLMEKDSILDDHDTLVFPPTSKTPYENKVVVRNETSIFAKRSTGEQKSVVDTMLRQEALLGKDGGEALDMEEFEEEFEEFEEGLIDEKDEDFEADDERQSGMDEQEMDYTEKLSLLTDLGGRERNEFYRFPLVRRIVKHQTGKGKVSRFSSLVVVGNGNGLVGYGEAKDFEGAAAFTKSLLQAYKNLDHVERFEQRTVWTEMSTKLGATQLVIRPRPVGFGLRCNPYVHQVLKAAGIKDASVKVWGSRNPGNVVKALFRILHAGNAPLAMGNGVGGGARKLEKGIGMRSALDIERERGRRMIQLQK